MALAKIVFGKLFGRESESGSAAIEFGLFLPLLLILLTGTVELGFLAYESMQVNNAVDAGIFYAAKNGWNAAAIASAAVSGGAMPSGLNALTATPAPTEFCGCPTAAGITKSASCVSPPACPDGSTPGTYVQVNAALNHMTILPTSWGLPATLTATNVIRIN